VGETISASFVDMPVDLGADNEEISPFVDMEDGHHHEGNRPDHTIPTPAMTMAMEPSHTLEEVSRLNHQRKNSVSVLRYQVAKRCF
jgi:hypothetical protein